MKQKQSWKQLGIIIIINCFLILFVFRVSDFGQILSVIVNVTNGIINSNILVLFHSTIHYSIMGFPRDSFLRPFMFWEWSFLVFLLLIRQAHKVIQNIVIFSYSMGFLYTIFGSDGDKSKKSCFVLFDLS